jgi:hypothetical protein
MASPRRTNTADFGKRVKSLKRVAYHEAGHAVLSKAIATEARYVSIRPDENKLGYMTSRPSATLRALGRIADGQRELPVGSSTVRPGRR